MFVDGSPEAVTWLTWKFLQGDSFPTAAAREYLKHLDCTEDIDDFFDQHRLSFPDELGGILESDAPPGVNELKLRHTSNVGIWAVYLLTLEKPGQRPKIYVGSGTDALTGVRSRFTQYDQRVSLPTNVRSSLKDGYAITSKAILCSAPIPNNRDRFERRAVFLVLETIFAAAFNSMIQENSHYDVEAMSLWPTSATTYDGCCSHAAVTEGLREGGAAGLKGQELTAYFDSVKQRASDSKKRVYYGLKERDYVA